MAVQVSKTPILNPSNLSSFQFWREKYKFVRPPNITREQSELCTQEVEQLVRANILKQGRLSHKDVIVIILEWGGGRRLIPAFNEENTEEQVKHKVDKVLNAIEANPNDVCSFISTLRMKAISIVFASKILRFLDPDNHRYGALDKHVAAFCNKHKVTNFKLNTNGRVLTNPRNIGHNIKEYYGYHLWLYKIADELSSADVRFQNVRGGLQDFTPVDVEMAIFAYCTQNRGC